MTVKYTPDHEWIEVTGDDGIAVIGITEHAQNALGDVVFVDLPEVGATFAAKDIAGVIESVKAAADVYAPCAGEILEVNEALRADPALANSDPLGEGWLFKMQLSDLTDFDELLDQPAYDELVKNS
ncbi:MAG: gcvH [Rhizobacter sp.]|jgi:glycine cleavage system H protein|nr:gcvH [Rhizobacter sp.]